MNCLEDTTKVYHLVGEQTIPVFLPAIQFQQGTKHFLLTTQAQKTKLTAQYLKQELSRRGFSAEILFLGPEENGSDFEALHSEMQKCLQITNPEKTEAMFNITGGTKPMAFIALTLCNLNPFLKAFYFDNNKRIITRLGTWENIPITETLRIEDFVGLCGMKIQRQDPDWEQSVPLSKMAYKLRFALTRLQADFSGLEKGNAVCKKYHCEDKNQTFELIYQELLKLIPEKLSDSWQTEFNTAFQGKSWMKKTQYLGGGWFENYICSVIYENNSEGIREIAQNMTVNFPDNRLAQEFDVIFTDGFGLTIVECKAGQVSQEHFHKLEDLCKNFSGAFGKGILAALTSSVSENNRKNNFCQRVKGSRSIAAFCDESGIALLGKTALSFRAGNIYEHTQKS